MEKINAKIVEGMIVLLIVFTFSSCSQDSDLDNLSDTVYLRHKDADMPAYIYGNGSEKLFLITLHGGPGGLGLGFRNDMFKGRIEKECAVVYFDQRGSGMSQGSYTEDGISIDIMAEDVLALVKVLKKKYGDDSRFFLLGHSWGGTLGSAALLKDQNDFLGWIELDGAHNASGIYLEYIANFERVANEQIALENSVDYWESVKDLVQSADNNEYNDDDFMKLNREAFEAENKLRDDGLITREEDYSDIAFDYNIFTAFWNTGVIQAIERRVFEDVDYTDQLSEITIPSLILWGKYDMVVPTTFAQEAFDNIGSTSKKLVIFEESGHSPNVTEPELFASEVIQFMNEHK